MATKASNNEKEKLIRKGRIEVTLPEDFDPRASVRIYTEGQEFPKLKRYVSLFEEEAREQPPGSD
ncbi:MAG: hypothetical protein H7A22_15625 [Spirochaetales bacterium]|nr:hypothetical protein [Spirochaetales bacterium]